MLTTASSPVVLEITKVIPRRLRLIPLTLHRLPRIHMVAHLQPLHTQLQGILATLTKTFWYIAKPSSAAAPGYYVASDGRRKWLSLGSPRAVLTTATPEYPLSQQPQQPPQPPQAGRRRGN